MESHKSPRYHPDERRGLRGRQVTSHKKAKVRKICFLFSVFCFLFSVFCFAQETNSESVLSQKISVDFRQTDIIETLKWLADKVGLNIAVSKDVKGKVTLFLKDVPAMDILDLILSTNKLAFSKKNNIITIMSEKEYFALYGQKYTDPCKTKTLFLKHISPADVVLVLEQLKSDLGKVIVNKNTGAIILIDVPTKIAQMQDAVNNLEVSSQMRAFLLNSIFNLKYARVETLKEDVRQLLTPDVGTLKIDKRTNTFIVSDFPNKLKEIEEMLAVFDKRPQQVLIEAKIVEITLNDRFQMGIEWEKLFSDANLHSLKFKGSFPLDSSLSSYQKISIGTLDADEYTATINLLKSIGKAELISSPRIAVLDGKEAKIKVVTREAYVNQTIEQTEVTTETAEAIEFLDVGTKLSVSPTVHKDGFVSLKIKPEISSVSKTLNTDLGSIIPIVDSSELETTVMLKSGAIVAIGGLIKETKTENTKQMPFVGSLPFVGKAVKSTDGQIERKEIVVFLSPKIIGEEEKKEEVREVKAKKSIKH